jgi:hypothetical protein
MGGMTPTEEAMSYAERHAASERDPWWRWKVDLPTPEVLARTIENLIAAGYELQRPDPWSTMPQWKRADGSGGAVYSVLIDGDDEYLSRHAVAGYGHWLDPCPKCGRPVDATYYSKATGMCGTCSHWAGIAAKRDKFVIVEHADGTRQSYQDAGNRTGGDKSHNGFGGHVFHIETLDGTPRWTTNNLFTQGTIPAHWWDELPVSHRFLDGSGRTGR